jgi:hypothetical protein
LPRRRAPAAASEEEVEPEPEEREQRSARRPRASNDDGRSAAPPVRQAGKLDVPTSNGGVPYCYTVTVEDVGAKVKLVPLHQSLSRMSGVGQLSLRSYANGVAVVSVDSEVELEAAAIEEALGGGMKKACRVSAGEGPSFIVRMGREVASGGKRRSAGVIERPFDMRVMEWWSKYTARRETGGAQQAFEGDAGEGMAPPSHESFNRERQLNVLSLLLHSAGTVEEMLAALAEKGPQVADAEVVYPLLLDKRRDLLHAKPLQGNSIAALDSLSAALETEVADLEFPLPAQSVRRKALESGEVEVLSSLRELAEDVVGKAACEAAQRALGPKRVVLAPMLMDGDPLGLLVFLVKEDQFDQELLEVFTGHATLALKNLTDLEQLGQFGDVDQVTWLHNRRYFMESLEREIVRAKRYRRPLSMIFMDIDRFSSFRNYGPPSDRLRGR